MRTDYITNVDMRNLTGVEVRKWAVQMALALTEDERNRAGGVIDAAKALETYALGPLAPEGR